MRIGQLSEYTGTPRRLLRYYEEQGLIISSRAANGYREYDERYVDRVLQIRGLLDAGLPTRVIKQILPCLSKPRTIHISDATPETIATLERERDRINERIQCLARSRDALTDYLDALRGAQGPDDPQADPVSAFSSGVVSSLTPEPA
ncbi:MerR family transcriptional regulator [Sphaerisporangium melleum]|uniref:MerR family transcriptional regulator n=1 Tax=Sphaerisporangium melleum TaxID=321316 RepID=A0A917RJM8_9ACTN|nr:MerR family transcriptional regulator [Sphaerisporangium melleum]GGL11475.1 MerR family transcriptional regulator [Sphaerisporangium melleum]GII71730.1 MerR family transcriptional regulator [Sphaerisporangium melleum]